MLRAAGASVALPFLEAMAAAKAPCRLMVVYAPTGMMMPLWTPAEEGTRFKFPRILAPLEKHRKDVLVLSGLAANNGRALGDGAGDHARAASSYLTGAHPRKTEGADIRCGVSMDQIAAGDIGAKTRFPSLELTCEDSRQAGACDSYSCVYQSIAWKSETQPLPPEMNPRAVFDRLFGGLGMSQAERDRRKSILDLVSRQAAGLKLDLGSADRRKLHEYMTSIREVETRIQRAEASTLPGGAERPGGIPPSFAGHARLMFDLARLAFVTDSTRVVTFMLAREGGLRNYPEAGVPEAHHSVTHHRNDPELMEKVAKINCYHLEQFAWFVERMKETADGEGSLFDHSALLYGSPLGDPNAHDHGNLPALVTGGGNGAIRGGRHVRYKAETPVTNLHVSLLEAAGVRAEKVGDSSGRVDLAG